MKAKQPKSPKPRDPANALSREETIQREVDSLFVAGHTRRDIVKRIGKAYELEPRTVDEYLRRSRRRYLPIITQNREEYVADTLSEFADLAERMDNAGEPAIGFRYREAMNKIMGVYTEKVEVETNADIVIEIGK